MVTKVVSCAFVCMVFVFQGCGSRKTIESYSPSSSNARNALIRALDTWKAGTKHGTISDSKPVVDVFDSRWQAGKKLESYEILDEIQGEQHPQFKVKQKLSGTPEESTTYIVIGIDPLMVFRDVDYKKTTGM